MIFRLIHQWRADRAMKRGHAAAKNGDWPAARDAAAAAAGMTTDNTDAIALVGLACFRLKDYAQAVESYGEVLVLRPADVAARRNLAMAFARMNQWREAQALFAQLAAERPDDHDITDALAFVNAKMSDQSTPPPASANAIKQAIAARQWTQVIALAQKELDAHPDNADAMLQQGLAYYHSEQFEQARQWFRMAVDATRDGEHSFRHAPALNNLATACMKFGDWRGAVESLEALESLIRHGAPGTGRLKHAGVLVNLVVCHRESGKPSLAKSAYRRLLETDPEAAAKIDPGDLAVPLGAAIKSSVQLGAKLELAEAPVLGVSEGTSKSARFNCSTCGSALMPSHKFCGSCGERVGEPVAQAV